MVHQAPDPPAEVFDEPLSMGEAGTDIMVNSDSEEEDNVDNGYELLATNDQDVQTSDSDSDSDESYVEGSVSDLPSRNPAVPIAVLRQLIAVSDFINPANLEKEEIVMDKERVDTVKAAMASFCLPESAIPPWAATVPEEKWKEQLVERLKSLQNGKSEN